MHLFGLFEYHVIAIAVFKKSYNENVTVRMGKEMGVI